MIMTVSTTDQSITSAGNISADSNERLLQQIENLDISQNTNSHGGGGTTTSVATADLLDMLEQDMSNKATKRNNNEYDRTAVYSSGDDNNQNRRRQAQRRYSGSSIEGSFTSKLLGGYTDLEELDSSTDNDNDNNNDDYGYSNIIKGEEMVDTHVTAEEEEFIPSILDDSAIKKSTSTNYASSNNNNYAASTNNYAASNSSGKSSSDNSYPQTTTIYSTPTKTQDGSGSRMLGGSASSNNSREQLYHSSDNSSKHHNMAPLASRPSFDNPFRSSTNSKTSSITSSGGGNNYDYGADISGSDSMGKHHKHKRGNSAAGNKHKREGYGSGNSRTPKKSNRPRPEMRGQHSVSFSIEEDQEADLSSEYMSTSHMTRTTQSSDQDTFSLGSLALSAGNSSRGSHTSRASSYTSRSSKSSRSSRSSHGSATTTSTHSSGNSTERRRRRELLPVKQDRSSSKKRSQTGGGGSISSMSGSSVSGGLGSAFSGSAFSTSSPVGIKPQKFHTHHSRRRKKASSSHNTTSNSIPDDASSDGSTSSRNLYTSNRRGTTSRSNRSHGSSHHSTNSNNSSNIKGDGEETLHANLHDHHPIHYPKRSGLYRFGEIEEGNEDDETGGMKNVDSHSDIMNGLIDTSGNSEEGGEGGKTADDVSSLGNSSLGRPVNVVRKDSGGSAGSGGKRGGDGRGKYEGVDNSSTDEDGLFRRVDKVRNEMLNKPSSSDSFLNGLIGNKKRGSSSSPKKNAYNQTTDEASEEERSFLSNLLAKNNAARQRKGGSVRSGDASGHSESSNLSADTISQINIYQKKHNERRASLDRGANMIRQGYSKVITSISRCYHDGGELLPNNQKEWIVLLVCTFLLMPLVHVAVIHAMGDGVGSAVDFYGDQIQFTGSLVQDDQHSSLYYAGEAEMAWAGSSQVMLSEWSSLHENFILMPDTDWIELQISRSKAAAKKSNGGGGLNNFLFHKNGGDVKPPKRLPLPSIIDPVYNSSAAVILYSLTAANSKKGAHSGMNEAANSDLWNAIQEQLAPPPIDAWPSWSHNSLAQFREDGFTLMYPYNQRQRARKIIKKLAKEFGQSVIYEYVTWSEMSPPADIGDAASSARGSVGFGGGTKHVGKDGYSSIVIPPMSNGRSDVMIRRTLSIRERWEEGDEPVVVMRRVKDLPVEDELTMREWEGPALEEIVWD